MLKGSFVVAIAAADGRAVQVLTRRQRNESGGVAAPSSSMRVTPQRDQLAQLRWRTSRCQSTSSSISSTVRKKMSSGSREVSATHQAVAERERDATQAAVEQRLLEPRTLAQQIECLRPSQAESTARATD